MTTTYFTDRGNKFNEDFVYAGNDFGIVIDGASGVSPDILTDYNTDAQALSHTFGSCLVTEMTSESTTEEKLEVALANTKFELYEGIDLPADYLSPSTTLSYFRILDNQIEIGWLGDSPIVVWLNNGQVEVYWDDIITKNDQKAIAQMYKYIEKGDSIKIAHDKILPILAQNRALKNKPDGYWSIDPSGVGINHLNKKYYNIADVNAVAVMSDGFYRLVDVFNVIKLEDGFEQIGSYQELVHHIDLLRKYELKDNSMLDYPRFKVSDDASIAIWTK